jgi:hypothetical protein
MSGGLWSDPKRCIKLKHTYQLYSQKLAERTQVGSQKESNGLGGDLRQSHPGDRPTGTSIAQHVAFAACGNTRENMTRVEAKDIPIISQAKVVKAGVVRLMELQERGWSYLRP